MEGRYSNRHHVASFVGFFPAEDPRIVMTVVVDEPKMKNGLTGYGGVVAAPAFSSIGRKIIGYMGLKPKPSRQQSLANRPQGGRSAL